MDKPSLPSAHPSFVSEYLQNLAHSAGYIVSDLMTDLPSDSDKPLRLFYALWPDDATRNALMHVQEHLQGRKTCIRRLHLTLAFLGAQPSASLSALEEILMQLPQPDMMLVLDRLGYFPRQKIAWAGMQLVPDALTELHRTLLQQLAQHDIVFDRSNFKPHVTLARDATASSDVSFIPIRWHATHIALVQSATQHESVSYRILASRTLAV